MKTYLAKNKYGIHAVLEVHSDSRTAFYYEYPFIDFMPEDYILKPVTWIRKFTQALKSLGYNVAERKKDRNERHQQNDNQRAI